MWSAIFGVYDAKMLSAGSWPWWFTVFPLRVLQCL
jgi:hypothetical protein